MNHIIMEVVHFWKKANIVLTKMYGLILKLISIRLQALRQMVSLRYFWPPQQS